MNGFFFVFPDFNLIHAFPFSADIANILSSLALIEKTSLQAHEGSRKPAFRWLGVDGFPASASRQGHASSSLKRDLEMEDAGEPRRASVGGALSNKAALPPGKRPRLLGERQANGMGYVVGPTGVSVRLDGPMFPSYLNIDMRAFSRAFGLSGALHNVTPIR